MSPAKRIPSDAISQFDDWLAAVFDKSSLGMVRVSPEMTIIDNNQKAAEIHGLPSLRGRSIAELVADQSSLDVIQSQADQRKQGLSTDYEIEVLHFPDRRRIPVKIAAMPMISSDGELAGLLAILRSLEIDRSVEAFEDAIHDAQGATDIFRAVCCHARPLLDFDFSTFSIVSRNGKHSRILLSYDPERQVESHKRWYPVSGALAEWVQSHEVQLMDFNEFLEKYPELQDDQTVRKFLAAGYKKLLRFPVVRGGRVVAAFSCMTKNSDGFSEPQLAIARALPVSKAFLMALHSLENDELSFRFNLIRDMFICRTTEEIGDVAASRLREQYGWESVEVYTIEEASRRIRLVSQSTTSPEYAMDESYSQSVEKGILGYACRMDRDVLIDHVRNDPRFRDLYVPLRRATLSELCMPIRVNGRISGLLNVEDRRESAFSEEEQENLRSLLDEIGGLFGAVWNKAVIASAFELTPSLVLIADTVHNIVEHNAAAVAQLGFSSAELIGSPLSTFFEDRDIAGQLLKASVASVETAMLRKDGTRLPVLVGSRELEGFGAWVISARDLTHQRRIAELESLRHMYREIAAQAKTPLSLACSWIQRLQRQSEEFSVDVAGILQKVLGQLKKVNITYDRLALYSQGADVTVPKQLLLNAGDLLKRTFDNLPKDLLSISGLDHDSVGMRNLYIRGDAFEMEFAVESTISYVERFLPPGEKVRVNVASADQRLFIDIEGPFPPEPACSPGPGTTPEMVCETVHEMALGSAVIERFMQQHNGSFRKQTMAGGDIRFRLDFPLASVEV